MMKRASTSTSICCVSKLIWHNKLGHPSDQALSSLKNKLKFGNEVLPPCDICYKAKQQENPSLLVNMLLPNLVS